MCKIGIGFDAHRLAKNKKLILGGVEISFDLGLVGHSDADVLTHAICDAILGAIGEGDIGTHFPDSDPKYKGISSLKLLSEILSLSNSKGFQLINIDSVVICERPKIAPYIDGIKKKISDISEIPTDSIGVKATTSDGMGFTGRREGIAAYAVVLLKK